MRGWILTGAVLLGGCGKMADLAECDEAIKAQLVTPSTYDRVEAIAEPGGNIMKYIVSFDAENSFGAPLRGQALCYIKDGTASAYITPQSNTSAD